MHFLFLRLMLVLFVLSIPTLGVSQKRVQKLHRIYEGPLPTSPGSITSDTFGFAAEAFIPDCEIWLFGERLKLARSPYNDNEFGILVSKSANLITINGHTYFSTTHNPAPTTSISSDIQAASSVLESAFSAFKNNASRAPYDSSTYVFKGIIFHPNIPTELTLDALGVTVTATVLPQYLSGIDYVSVEYDGFTAAAPIKTHKPKASSDAQKIELRLDNSFNSITAACEPQSLVLLGRGYRHIYSMADRDALIAALQKIPKLAVPKIVDPRGEIVYESITINNFVFHYDVIRDFVTAAER